MNSFINRLSEEFDIQISASQEPMRGQNSYLLGKDGDIETLFLDGVSLQNLDVLLPIADKLEVLSVENCSIERIGTPKAFSNLKKLSLNENPLEQSTFENLIQLQNLRDLDLSLTTIKDTTPLGSLTNLQKLNLSFNVDLYDVKGLENLKSLTHLELRFSEVDKIEKIAVNENIQSINIHSGEISEITGLERFPNLIELDLSGNIISKIEGLTHLIKLKRLNISSTWIHKIEGLRELKDLEILDLHRHEIKKIEGLDHLINLKKLNLSENQIEKVENLDNLTNLEFLLLDYNRIVDVNVNFLHLLRNSCDISLVGNPIKEINTIIPNNVKVYFKESNWVPKSF